MNPLLIGLIALVALIVLMLLRVPIGISMFIVGAGGLLLTKGTVLANYCPGHHAGQRHFLLYAGGHPHVYPNGKPGQRGGNYHRAVRYRL